MIQNLPAEIIVKIFSNLGTADLLIVSLVCQRWREIASMLLVDKVQIVVTEEIEPLIDVLRKTTIVYKHWLFKCLELKVNEKFMSVWDSYASNAVSMALIDVEISEKDLWILLSKCANLRELSLGGLGPMFMTVYFLDNKPDQRPVRGVFSKLNNFHLTGSRYLSDAIFSHLTDQLKCLETFSLSGCQISYQQSIYKRFYPPNKQIKASEHVFTFKHLLRLIALNASTLKHISFGRTTIDNQSLADFSVIKNLHLDSLELIACNQLSRVGIQNLVEHQRNLTSLDLSFCARITDYGIIAIVENIPKIKHLNICRCQSVSQVGLRLLRKLTHLEWLDISRLEIRNWECIDEALGKDVRLPLKWLNCAFLTIQWETVSALARTAPNLEHLDLSLCTYGVNDQSIQSLCKLTFLRCLDVSGCASLSDFGLTDHEAPNLEFEVLEGPALYQFSLETLGLKRRSPFKVPLGMKAEQAIRYEAQVRRYLEEEKEECLGPSQSTTKLCNLKGLRKLSLSGCIRITDLTLTSAISFNELYSLNLSHCQQIGDSGLIPMVNKCPALEELILDECGNITDQAILVIAHRLRRLKSLSLQNCIKLTDDSIDSLSNCRSLRYLDVCNCVKITREQIYVLRNRLPRISNLSCRNIRPSSIFGEAENADDPITIPTPPPLLSKILKRLSR